MFNADPGSAASGTRADCVIDTPPPAVVGSAGPDLSRIKPSEVRTGSAVQESNSTLAKNPKGNTEASGDSEQTNHLERVVPMRPQQADLNVSTTTAERASNPPSVERRKTQSGGRLRALRYFSRESAVAAPRHLQFDDEISEAEASSSQQSSPLGAPRLPEVRSMAASGDRFPSPAPSGQLNMACGIYVDQSKTTLDGMRKRAVRRMARTFPGNCRGNLKQAINFNDFETRPPNREKPGGLKCPAEQSNLVQVTPGNGIPVPIFGPVEEDPSAVNAEETEYMVDADDKASDHDEAFAVDKGKCRKQLFIDMSQEFSVVKNFYRQERIAQAAAESRNSTPSAGIPAPVAKGKKTVEETAEENKLTSFTTPSMSTHAANQSNTMQAEYESHFPQSKSLHSENQSKSTLAANTGETAQAADPKRKPVQSANLSKAYDTAAPSKSARKSAHAAKQTMPAPTDEQTMSTQDALNMSAQAHDQSDPVLTTEQKKSTHAKGQNKSAQVIGQNKSAKDKDQNKSAKNKDQKKSAKAKDQYKSTLVTDKNRSAQAEDQKKSTPATDKSAQVTDQSKSAHMTDQSESAKIHDKIQSVLAAEQNKSTQSTEDQSHFAQAPDQTTTGPAAGKSCVAQNDILRRSAQATGQIKSAASTTGQSEDAQDDSLREIAHVSGENTLVPGTAHDKTISTIDRRETVLVATQAEAQDKSAKASSFAENSHPDEADMSCQEEMPAFERLETCLPQGKGGRKIDSLTKDWDWEESPISVRKESKACQRRAETGQSRRIVKSKYPKLGGAAHGTSQAGGLEKRNGLKGKASSLEHENREDSQDEPDLATDMERPDDSPGANFPEGTNVSVHETISKSSKDLITPATNSASSLTGNVKQAARIRKRKLLTSTHSLFETTPELKTAEPKVQYMSSYEVHFKGRKETGPPKKKRRSAEANRKGQITTSLASLNTEAGLPPAGEKVAGEGMSSRRQLRESKRVIYAEPDSFNDSDLAVPENLVPKMSGRGKKRKEKSDPGDVYNFDLQLCGTPMKVQPRRKTYAKKAEKSQRRLFSEEVVHDSSDSCLNQPVLFQTGT